MQLLILALRLTGIIMLCVRMTLGPDASAAPFTYLGAISPLMASAVFETGQEVGPDWEWGKGNIRQLTRRLSCFNHNYR